MDHSKIDKINETLFFKMPPARMPVAVLFGAKSVSGSIARDAAALYRKGLFQQIILTGGNRVFEPHAYLALKALYGRKENLQERGILSVDFLSVATEVDYMEKILKAEGVPTEKTIVFKDNNSKNTKENLEEILRQLRQFDAATFITFALSQRRGLMTARKHPELNRMALATHPVYPFGLTKENWPDFRNKGFLTKLIVEHYLFEEMDKVHPVIGCVRNGDCVEVDIPKEIERLAPYLI